MRFGSDEMSLPCGEVTAAAPCVGAAAGVTASAVGLHEEAMGGGYESRRATLRCAGCRGDVIEMRCNGVYGDTNTGLRSRLGRFRDATGTRQGHCRYAARRAHDAHGTHRKGRREEPLRNWRRSHKVTSP